MKLEITGKNYEASPKLLEVIEKKTAKLSKYLGEDDRVKVNLKAQKSQEIMEITVYTQRRVIRSERSAETMFYAVDEVIKRLERQLATLSDKHDTKTKKGEAISKRFGGDAVTSAKNNDDMAVVRTKTFVMKPTSIEDAIESLEMLEHSFYVFQNDKTKQINVIYKRIDGGYGIIEAQL